MCTAVVLLGGVLTVAARWSRPTSSSSVAPIAAAAPATVLPFTPAAPPSTEAPPPATTTTTAEPAPIGPVALTGCPPPPRPPSPPSTPWHPAVLVPDAALPQPAPAAPRLSDLSALDGKGMWIWKYRLTEQGDTARIIARAQQAGLHQLWIRVADSQDGFYGASVLAALVPAAHRAGISVVGWGFPYLYDPVGDAAWTAAALNWRAGDGSRIDAFSPDIETASEGTALSQLRASVYLSLVRAQSAPTGRPLVATVFPPTDRQMAVYPYAAMAPYVDAFAPMVYWSCTEPGDAAAAALQRLGPLAPVHLIGQAYDMGPEGGRVGAPTGDEIRRFLDVAHRTGARGASFWVWQDMTADEWAAMAGSPWPAGS